jgi:N-methylhydantoinase B/oxoprolinase/acetone carboxylase alpha subunit
MASPRAVKKEVKPDKKEIQDYGKNIHATTRAVALVSAIHKQHGIKKYKIIDSAILEYAEKYFKDVKL